MIIKTAIKDDHMIFAFSITMRLSTHSFELHNVTSCIYLVIEISVFAIIL